MTRTTPMSTYRRNCIAEMGTECFTCPEDNPVDGMDEIVVHHIDGDRSNDDLSNLMPVCRSCHAKIHHGSGGYEEWHEKLCDSAQRGSGRSSTKDKTALTMYLSPSDVNNFDLHFQEVALEYRRKHGERLEKNADFYPAVIKSAQSHQTTREILGLSEEEPGNQ